MQARAVRGAAGWEVVAVAVLVCAGVALRVWRLDLGWFGIDQARDVATALDLVNGRGFPMIGPTMRRVTRLGALYYYFWSLPFVVWSDPIVGYWFAALLAVIALLLTWALARRCWGPLAGLVTLAFGAAHPIWIIDGRVYWAPAALPVMAVVIAWMLIGGRARVCVRRAVWLGVLLGLALQLHLSMAGWAIASALVMLLDRVPWRTCAWGACAAAVVAMPAAAAMLWNADGDLGMLAARGPRPALLARLATVGALPERVLSAFSHGDASAGYAAALVTSPTTALATGMATAGLSLLALAGIVRLGARALGGERTARVLLLLIAVPTALVVSLPGEIWYYYLDGILPLGALAAGAVVAPGLTSSPRSLDGPCARSRPGKVHLLAVGVAGAAALVLVARMAGWLAGVDGTGYIQLEPTLLTLDGTPTRDAPAGGRIVTLGIKRHIAAFVSGGGADLADAWLRLHGPAWTDATGDNGFWLEWYGRQHGRHLERAETRRAGNHGPPDAGGVGDHQDADPRPVEDRDVVDPGHVTIWYRDDPLGSRVLHQLVETGAPILESRATIARPVSRAQDPPRQMGVRLGEVEAAVIGPLLAVRHVPAIDYASCRAGGMPVAVPIRVVPNPRRYGEGVPEVPRELPPRLECVLVPGSGTTLVVAALGGGGSVRLTGPDGARSPAGRETSLCVTRSAAPLTFIVEIDARDGAGGELDVYDVPLGVGCSAQA